MSDPKIRIRATDDTSAAFRTANANLAAMQASAARTSLSILSIGSSLAAVASVTAISAIFKSVVDGVDAFNDLADATGSSIENLSALDRVASRTGTSFDTVSGALLKLNQSLTAATPGSDVETIFKALGLSIAELKAADPSEALRRTSVALAGFAADGDRARAMQVLFGKSTKEVAGYLKNLAESGALVATMTTAQGEAAEKFNKQLALMGTYSRDAARTVSGPLVEAFNSVAAAIQKAAREQTGWFASLQSMADQAAKKSDAMFTGSWSPPAGGGRGFVNPAFVLPSVGDITRDKAKEGKGRAGAPAHEEISDAQRELASYVDQLQRTIEKTQDLTEAEKARTVLLSLGATGQVQQVKELVLGMAEQIDAPDGHPNSPVCGHVKLPHLN